ncbi:uncharacterized protein BO66DRAFT_392386 [Aspergillus aculeatinus CBS 121060]|uniref:Uncharacterized protein n=1 Tax=Aspergillus aculeatinus CBS 121060 TaxID=1448322 RepID=A0ACD1H7J7_9EURO|nr:hypothetical protein BO66DRAFT_392386 [Aspergillus aculeatinus CBS 121060]RAH69382.1 hypothetical protein BO66DRAFT_392386 [Aspergillus aculeatinus CBS 121060]
MLICQRRKQQPWWIEGLGNVPVVGDWRGLEKTGEDRKRLERTGKDRKGLERAGESQKEPERARESWRGLTGVGNIALVDGCWQDCRRGKKMMKRKNQEVEKGNKNFL